MNRGKIFTPAVAAFLCMLPALGQSGVSDPVFSTVPFERWLSEGEQAHFRWSVRVGAAELSSHQRLQTRVEVQVDGNELVSRRGHGQLLIMVQFQDGSDRLYQAHAVLDLQDVKDEAAKSNIQYVQDAFVLPGDYRVGVVILDAKTGEHSAALKPLHVNPLRNDPLAGAWKDLPPVELLHALEPPDRWYLPDIEGRLQLPVTTRRPIQIELLMNASPSGPSRGLSVGTVNSGILANMLPALKVLSRIELSKGALNLALLDIPKRRVLFEQNATRKLDWARMREALTQADPNKIDVRALEHREQNAQFFLGQVRQRLSTEGAPQTAEEPLRILIVLSGPMTFDSGENTRPIEPVAGVNGRVFYVRYHLPPERLPIGPTYDSLGRIGRRSGGGPNQPAPAVEAFDSLAPLLKPLQPRMFDIYSPEQFRKALSSLIQEISRL